MSIPNFATSVAFVDTATKCLATADSSPPNAASAHSRALRALVSVSSVVNVFDEIDEQRLGGIEIVGGLPEVGAVDVAHEPERHVALGEVAERVVGHVRAEIGAADADVDDVADALAGVAGPRRRDRTRSREVGHLAQDRVHRGHHVLAVDLDDRALRRAQRDVQHGAVLGDVDLLAAEHRVDALPQPGAHGRARRSSRRVSSVMRFFE